MLTVPDESEDTGYMIMLNLAYNFQVSDKMLLFVLGRAGYGNGPSYLTFVMDWDMGVSAYNFGAGFKYFVGNSAAVCIEYRYIKFSGEETRTYSWGDYTVTYEDTVDRRDHNISMGVSIFF